MANKFIMLECNRLRANLNYKNIDEEEDEFEIVEGHPEIQLIFGNLLIGEEHLLPGRLSEWRKHTRDRSPFRYGQA